MTDENTDYLKSLFDKHMLLKEQAVMRTWAYTEQEYPNQVFCVTCGQEVQGWTLTYDDTQAGSDLKLDCGHSGDVVIRPRQAKQQEPTLDQLIRDGWAGGL